MKIDDLVGVNGGQKWICVGGVSKSPVFTSEHDAFLGSSDRDEGRGVVDQRDIFINEDLNWLLKR